MTGALFRNAASDAARIFRLQRATMTNPFGKLDPLPIGGNIQRLQSRPFYRTPQFLGKAKETGVSGFCSSSSSSSSTVSTAGFIGWYLGMVKSRPVLTKSVTSSLIYIAADLSSQVISKIYLIFVL